MSSYGSPYGSPQYQPASFVDSVGNFFGNLGNNMQGGSDQAMYGGNTAGLPYATTEGVINSPPVQAGVAVGQAASNALNAGTNFFSGLARGGGALLGIAIIAVALAHESRNGRR